MRVDDHLIMARRLEASLAKLSPAGDFEMALWISMQAGTHLLNAALHASGLTEADEGTCTMTYGVYLYPAPGGGFREETGGLGDMMHANKPALQRPAPPALAEAMEALGAIEGMGATHVRGPQLHSPEAEAGWRRAFETVKRNCAAALAEHNR